MPPERLLDRARQAGIESRWVDAAGHAHDVSESVLQAVLAALGDTDDAYMIPPILVTGDVDEPLLVPAMPGSYGLTLEQGERTSGQAEAAGDGHVQLPPIAEPGYHRLEIGDREITLAVAPRRCWTLADATDGRRAWGLTVQLYGLTRAGAGDLGDFRGLTTLVRQAGIEGADALAISPVHAQFAADPGRFTPYSPSSRLMLNGLHGDPGPIADDAAPPSDGLVDWPAAAAARMAAFRHAFANMAAEQGKAFAQFEAFRRASGETLQRHARFEAIHAARVAQNPADWDWREWPVGLRQPNSDEVARFAADHSAEVAFHAYLQFLADTGFAAAQQAADDAGMAIGLIADIAVGVSPSGSDAWSCPAEMLNGLTIGAPPDLYNARGQDWGVTGFSPRGLAANGYRSFLAMLRAAFRHAGGIRLDHVMGLSRLWVVPRGNTPADGAYLRFPFDAFLRLVKLESRRHRAIVLGEDLGTVPDGLRERLDNAGLAGMRVLWFERAGHFFTSPRAWSPNAVAMTSTHDLPTVAGWWSDKDLDWKDALGLGATTEDREMRAQDRQALWASFKESGATDGKLPEPSDARPAVDAACAHIGTAACGLALLPLEDALALPEQPNLPGTVDEHPNWRRRLPAPVETMLAEPAVAARLQALAKARKS